jgi:hypothetical protein
MLREIYLIALDGMHLYKLYKFHMKTDILCTLLYMFMNIIYPS